jgi:putative Mg2+ transporter-C (MgtC) family protein
MNQTLEMGLRILLAAVLGAIVGWQREKAHRPAGLRTHILISMGAALFTVVSVSTAAFPTADPSRIAAGIVTGVGFIGAGTILHRTRFIEGLTTAASIWVIAAVGMAAGAGLYVISAITTLIVFVVLLLPHPSDDEHINHKD